MQSGNIDDVKNENQQTIRAGSIMISKSQLNQVIDRILSDVSSSIISTKTKKDTAMSRICPLCSKSIGNFGGNFKNHFKKCCLVIYEELLRRRPEYFGSLKQMRKVGLIEDDRASSSSLSLNLEDDEFDFDSKDVISDSDSMSNDSVSNDSVAEQRATRTSSNSTGFLTQNSSDDHVVNASQTSDIKSLMKELSAEQQRIRKTQKRKEKQPVIQSTPNKQNIHQSQPPTPQTPSMYGFPMLPNGGLRYDQYTSAFIEQQQMIQRQQLQMQMQQQQQQYIYPDYDTVVSRLQQDIAFMNDQEMRQSVLLQHAKKPTDDKSVKGEYLITLEPENYTPWKKSRIEEATLRYLSNCGFMNDAFFQPLPEEETELYSRSEDFVKIKQQLTEEAKQIDEDIIEAEKSLEAPQQFSFSETLSALSGKSPETAKRKLDEYFATTSSIINSSKQDEPQEKRRKRNTKILIL